MSNKAQCVIVNQSTGKCTDTHSYNIGVLVSTIECLSLNELVHENYIVWTFFLMRKKKHRCQFMDLMWLSSGHYCSKLSIFVCLNMSFILKIFDLTAI